MKNVPGNEFTVRSSTSAWSGSELDPSRQPYDSLGIESDHGTCRAGDGDSVINREESKSSSQ